MVGRDERGSEGLICRATNSEIGYVIGQNGKTRGIILC
jgi:hypothetical protein